MAYRPSPRAGATRESPGQPVDESNDKPVAPGGYARAAHLSIETRWNRLPRYRLCSRFQDTLSNCGGATASA